MTPPRKARVLVPAAIPGGSTPAAFGAPDALAIQALAKGTANEGQQKHALGWILNSACGVPVWAYRPEQRETDIALGRQFVGQQIVGLMKVNVSKLQANEERSNG